MCLPVHAETVTRYRVKGVNPEMTRLLCVVSRTSVSSTSLPIDIKNLSRGPLDRTGASQLTSSDVGPRTVTVGDIIPVGAAGNVRNDDHSENEVPYSEKKKPLCRYITMRILGSS